MTVVKMQRRHSPTKTEASAGASVPSPGRRLQLAREAMGMEVATVAEQLHLSKILVQALEEENYEILPARVFVRGYYRNFARLVGVPEEIVLKEFGQRCPEGEDCSVPPAVAQGVRREIRSSHGLVRLVTWLIIIALLTVFGLWWKSYLDKGSVVEDAAEFTTPVVDTREAPPAEVPESIPAAPTAPTATASDAAEKPKEISETDTQSTVSATETAPEAASLASEVPASTGENEQPLAEDTTQQVAVPPRVLLSFTGDCWVDVRDSTRGFKLVGRRQAGEKYELKGKPPYKMVLGNARNVSIKIDGMPFDLAPYTRGNVAKLTFDPTKN